MLATTFIELFDLYLDGAKVLQSDVFGLNSFSRAEFIEKNYELIGDLASFHFYEKSHEVSYFQRKLTVVFKYYFDGEEGLGSGLYIAGGARLTSTLKRLLVRAGKKEPGAYQLSFFFSEDKREGAVIIDDRVVVRFDQWGGRNAYVVSTVECDFSGNGPYGDVARKTVKETLNLLSLGSMKAEAKDRNVSRAFCRLVDVLLR